jgi:type I restriction enzyme S subunit
MRRTWKILPLSAVPVQIIDGDRGKNYPKQTDFSESGYCLFLNAGNVTSNGFDFSNCQFINEDKDQALRKGRLSRDDVVMTTRGTIGNVSFFDEKVVYDSIRINSGMVIFRTTPNELSPAFLYHYLRSPDFEGQTISLRSGVAQPQLPIRDIKLIQIPLPDVDTQYRIASILSAYDDLIENNRRRMALLEEVARQLYQEWFVRFRFPGHEQTRIIDGVPEGWEFRSLGEIAEVVMGQSPESKYYNETGDGLPFHQGVADFGNRFVSNRIYTTAQNRIANEGDILCSVRAPVGRINITTNKIVIGRGLAAIRSRSSNQSFLFYQLRNHFFKEDLIGTGAIFASVTRAEFEGQKLLTPSKRLIQSFENASCPIDEQLRVLFLQNQKLRAARDMLLPRLMNGEIVV